MQRVTASRGAVADLERRVLRRDSVPWSSDVWELMNAEALGLNSELEIGHPDKEPFLSAQPTSSEGDARARER